MAVQPFNPDAESRRELMESRSRAFINVEIRAAKGDLADPPLTHPERALMRDYIELTKRFPQVEIDSDRPW